MSDDLIRNASDLADYITGEVLDDEGITEFGLLDALASCGLTLVTDEAGVSSTAYYNRIKQVMAGQD